MTLDNGIILSSNLGYVTTIVQRDDEIWIKILL